MSVYVLSSRVSTVEWNVDDLGRKADSVNAVLYGITTINGLALLNGPVTLSSRITGIAISDVAGLQTALDLKAPSANPTFTGTKEGITKDMIGLGSVDNVADLDKPISTATQTALDGKADKTNTYTKGDVDLNISNLIASAPEALNTLNELAQAVANDPSHATTVFNQLSLKVDKSSTYTKTEVDASLGLKSNQFTTYTKTEVDNLLSPKATTTYVYDRLALKANQPTTYTKTETDTALGLKANLSDMTAALALKANVTYVDNHITFKANQTTTYTQIEVNDLLTPKATITYVHGQLDLKRLPTNHLH